MLPNRYHIACYLLLLTTGLTTCREPFAPPAITQPNRFLVVDGFINTGPNTITTFNLNRTRNLGDTTIVGIPESNAQISIVGSNGNTYPLADTAEAGIYSSAPLTLDVTQLYHIVISTTAGEKFSSDPVPCLANPPIDSVFWRQPFDLGIYASTHDPTDNTHYYRYDYNIPNSDPKVDIDYSILVRQYALTADAYNYWLLIQKTTQDVGTLFDVQPTQLTGNIHCTTNPAEPVIGFVSATNVQQQRIYIFESSFHDWTHNQPGFNCDTMTIPTTFANPFAYNYPNPDWAPYYFESNIELVLVSAVCLNCTLVGGTNIRPPFMPN
jgi:hypothetical protein